LGFACLAGRAYCMFDHVSAYAVPFDINCHMR
jgi:hypothetical protein